MYQPSVPLLQDSVARMEILTEYTNITSTLFSPEEERDESAHDITLDFSLDTSSEFQHLTSTPAKSNTGAADHSCDSDTHSEVSVDPPDFSPLSSPTASHHGDTQSVTLTESQNISGFMPLPVPQDESEKERGIKLVGDNVDKTIKSRYMRVDKQGKSLHYFHCFAAEDRFDLTMPEDVPPIPVNPKLFEDLLPSDSDKSKLKEFFSVHVARILYKHMPFFADDFSQVIPEHLDHPMSSEMSQKSNVVSFLL